MSEVWVVVVALGAGTFALKGIGPALLGGAELPRPLAGVVPLLAPAMLSALVLTQALTDGTSLTLDARGAGLAAAAVAVAARAPVIAVVAVATIVAALVRSA